MEDFRNGARILAHWGFTVDTEHSWVTGELLLLSSGVVLRRYGGSTWTPGLDQTTYHFTRWSEMFRLDGDVTVERAARSLGGYDLHLPGPTRVDRFRVGPFPGGSARAVPYTSPEQLPDYTRLDLDFVDDPDDRPRE
ncbi:hypothetical protein [Lentzea sp. NPDC003310]|uniref:hypothetical protein n=1 Tax=Lentzea sp. NPDC003310 TaxID=3154447 RepID=UPI0033AB112C